MMRRIGALNPLAMQHLVALLTTASLGLAHVAGAPPNIALLIGDNWQYGHAGANGCAAAKTPTFDRIAREGMRFTNAFCPVPSCSPTRSCILTGRAAHQLEDAANLWSKFPSKFKVFTDALSEAGYHVGHTGKGWSPGNFKDYGRTLSPAGKEFPDLAGFLAGRKPGQPFFFWQGDTHTALHQFKKIDGVALGIDPQKIRVPAYLPDNPLVRREIADYLGGVMRMDAAFGETMAAIEMLGELDNTVVFCLSDNGWQMPRGLANCHDSGSRVPLAVRWPGRITAGATSDAFVNLTDLAPTFLELVGLKPWPEMTARSFLDVLTGQGDGRERDHVFLERERHANVRRGDLSYPCRGIRTAGYMYLRNLRPDRWPAGDPELYYAVGPYGDVDPTRTKDFILERRDEPGMKPFFRISFAKRPAEELYELGSDPDQVRNRADDPMLAGIKATLRARVDAWMRETRDPRVDPATDIWDRYPYLGQPMKKP